jgi:D-alanyl-D-alanine carboxypeptidase/D-alanyl-D-alanine-endopeptidase (penicillin-binding protein 4)
MIRKDINIFVRKIITVLFLLIFISGTSLAIGVHKTPIDDFKERVNSIVSTISCDISVKIVSTTKNDILYEYKPDLKMIPASITKAVTSSTAIYTLGSGFMFKTAVYTDDNNIQSGVINGNIYLKGFGDPDLSSNDISNLVQQLLNKNITEIKGNIIYDDSYFDDMHYGLANYYKSDTKSQYWPYIGAINLDKNKSYKDPALSAAQLLSDKLTGNNIKLDGIVISGSTPASSRELGVILRSLYDVLVNMNKPSDNQSALCVFKVVGAVYQSPPGTLNKGSDAVIDFLTTIGIDRNSFEFVEGSGLSRYNFVTADVYIKLLKYMFEDEKTFDIFFNSLPIAGVDGTLKNRMVGTEAERNVHAKTGTINNVSTLTGYAITRDSEPVSFFIAMNGFGDSPNFYRDKQDEICEAICEFSRK